MAEAERVVRVVARTVDEACRRAAHQLHVAPSLLEAEVVGARRSGLFGLGEPKLEVLVWFRQAEEREEEKAPSPQPPPAAAGEGVQVAWHVNCRAGECFLDVHTPGPWLHEVEEHVLLWPLDEYQRDAVRQALSGPQSAPVRFGLIAPPDEAAAQQPFFVKITRDGMAAWAVPGQGGQPTAAELEAALEGAGVKAGIDAPAITHAAQSPLLEPVLLARGSEATPSRDAAVEYLFSEDDELETLRPRVREDGTVDYRDLKPMYTVQPGTVVGRYLPAINGEPGRDVFGQELKPVVPGRETPAERFAGRDVQVAENGIDLVATKAGRPVRDGARIDIVEVYAIVGDIDFSTGNVDFKGEVYVSGDVQPGFSV
ncbi:MAG TPA: FapA family protein, partial [Chloroflexota bacterium]|nr:FapA family protein [Chloroflexota bacterium]